MNKRQKIVQEQFINNEEAVIKRLKTVYKQSLEDVTKKSQKLYDEIETLTAELDFIEDEEEREIQKSKIRSKVYQKKYQDSLKKQVGDVLDKMQEENFQNVSDYLNTCYEEAFAGTLYDLQGQGIPLAFPIDQEAMVRAVQTDSKISQGLYSRLGEDTSLLKRKITAQVSRGIATGMSFKQVAQQLSGYTNIGFNNAVRIARTEGHRIQCQSTMDACHKAKDRGADVVKMWDSTLDAKTRDSHAKVDGEIKELDEKFSNGLMFPGDPSGGAAEVVNCRCALLQRARWALEGGFTKMNNFTKELESFESPEEYAEFKKGFFSKENRNYMNYVQQMEDKYKTKDFRKVLDKMDDREYKHYKKLLEENPVFNKKQTLKVVEPEQTFTEIKDAIDFAYGDFSDKDYIKWMDDYDKHNNGVSLSSKELKIIDDYTEGSFISLNDVNRYSDSELLKKGYSVEDISRIREKADVLDGALSKYDLDTDIVTHRFERDVSWLTGKGNDIADLEALVGKEYTAKGFTSSGMLPNRFRFTGGKTDAVHFEIVTPKGTNGAFLSMSKKGENEFLYNRNTRFKILDGGERIVKEHKYNFKTGTFDEVDVTERFLKVQVIPDKVIKKSAFVPAKTIDEAQETIRQFVDDKQFAALGVSYKGISVEAANAVNKALIDLYDEYDLDKLGGVFVAKGNTKLGKMVDGATAAYSPIRNSLIINNRAMKNVDDVIKSHAEEVRLIKMYADDPSSVVFSTKRAERVAKASVLSGRATVPETFEDVISHEMGHVMEKAVSKSPNFDKIKNNMSKYAEKISGYATEDMSEYIAESFASYRKGENLIDPDLKDIFQSLKKGKNQISLGNVTQEVKNLDKIGKNGIIISDKQFGKKTGKHAVDYGLNVQNPEDREKMRNIITDIIENKDDFAEGDWRGQNGKSKFFIKGEDVVVINDKNEFVTILKGGVNNERIKNARKR